ncbi:ATP-binding cassette domain-containing protein [Streptosporangium sp. NBC_01755]|uniref:ABC transporter ATP-binding protein n=1 Tax=unclassified Streptosporangium TaxID=2632669 RepID=UPI002DD90914|nr:MULTISPECIES: ATP-binding cassette domain-containing protein [unclassified Streptosporangium]WSA26712.1 ATP-binding cassette domain-containing protein [Streptosporangium sp. NBC_01810]WSD01864.1 ATP-binding cassette domain-containing protein [Streptosporangium sp. NBC_01755]
MRNDVEATYVHAEGLVKRYGALTAVDGIDLRIVRGEAFGFLGPNAAGKSSVMRMIGCVSPVTEGLLRVFDTDIPGNESAIKQRLGVVPQDDSLDEDLTVHENMIVYARYFGMSWRQARAKSVELLEFVHLNDRSGDKVANLSGGMRRRLTMARALVSDPDMLLLDEPTTGLDPQARQAVWDRLHRLKSQGVTLVVTTHYMEEAEQLCDRLVIMDTGRIVAEGSPRELIERYSTREVVEIRADSEVVARFGDRLSQLAKRVETMRDRTLLYTDDGDRAAIELVELGLTPEVLLVRRSGLEDVFLRLTGRALTD